MSTPEEETKETTQRKSVALAGARPSRLSMEGYIYNAHTVLESALDPSTPQVSVELMEKCKGVVIVTAVHVGAIVTLYYGTGLLLKKLDDDGKSWSPPSAISVGGTSFGAVVGGKRDNSIIFIMTDEAMKDFVNRPQSRIALDAYVFFPSLSFYFPPLRDLPVPFCFGFRFLGFRCNRVAAVCFRLLAVSFLSNVPFI